MKLPDLATEFKSSTILFGDDGDLSTEYVPTNIPVLDNILSGGRGLPKGRTIILYGAEGSGKTFLSQQFARGTQAQGGTVLLVDAERCYDAEWWEKTGVDISKLVVAKPLTGEDAFDIAISAVKQFDCVIVDSFASLLPTAEYEKNMIQVHIAPQARMINKGLRKITAVNEHCIFVVIQQVRERMVPFGNPTMLPGGKGQMFHASIMLQVSREAWIVEDEQRIGMNIKIATAKNKLYPPWLECIVPMLFNGTIDFTHMLFEIACESGIIERKGPYYYWDGKKWLGRMACMEYVKANADKLQTEINRHKSTPDITDAD